MLAIGTSLLYWHHVAAVSVSSCSTILVIDIPVLFRPINPEKNQGLSQ